MEMSDQLKPSKRRYTRPSIVTVAIREAQQVLLLCTGTYNCIDEVGYDCCQPNPSTCFTNC